MGLFSFAIKTLRTVNTVQKYIWTVSYNFNHATLMQEAPAIKLETPHAIPNPERDQFRNRKQLIRDLNSIQSAQDLDFTHWRYANCFRLYAVLHPRSNQGSSPILFLTETTGTWALTSRESSASRSATIVALRTPNAHPSPT